MKLFAVVLLCCLPFSAFTQAPPTTKQAPPPGIPIPKADAEELRATLHKLDTRLAQLGSADLLPDVEIFAKAVRYALSYDEFFKTNEIQIAKVLLTEGLRRADELPGTSPSWTMQRGSVVRGYRSKIDGSVQPYGLRVPDDWRPDDKKPRPLYLWFHGRSDTLTELAFMGGQSKGKREFAPPNAFELHLYGRYCNASKFAGEGDAFEALQDVMKHYPIDTNRLAVLGFSMGGATIWHIATHYAGLWAAASPGAGFAETAIYAKVFDKGEPPPPWEQTLWRLYDATRYAANLSNIPLIAYSGEIDPQKQSADIMEKAMADEGLTLERLIDPNTAHKYEPATKEKLSQRIDSLVKKGCDPYPRQIRFVTYTLRYNRMKWVTIDQLDHHWGRAEVEAKIEDDTLRVKTENVAAFTITLPQRPDTITINGEKVEAPPGPFVGFCQLRGKWQRTPPDFGAGMHKHYGLTGPIDDAFMDSFMYVRPTGQPVHPRVGAWAEQELERAIREWRRVFRGDARVKNDTEITADDIAQSNLILWGDPGSNRYLARILSRLPLTWSSTELILAGVKTTAADHAPILIYPNPLNPERYIVVNSGFTFRQGSTTSNSLQTPKLPDWAVVDLRTPPSLKWPGLITDAGFFDERWQVAKP